MKKTGEYGTPDIFNADQGSQFASFAFTNVLRYNWLRISMDGRGRRTETNHQRHILIMKKQFFKNAIGDEALKINTP